MLPIAQNASTKMILGVSVWDASAAQALALVDDTIAERGHIKLAFLNAHGGNLAATLPKFRDCLTDFIVISDGIGLDVAARILYGRAFKENLNGTDFVPAILKQATKPLKIALYGAKPGIAQKAALTFATMAERHQYRAVGDGYTDASAQAAMLADLAAWQPDILLVAKGMPAQEYWIADHITPAHCRVAIAVGALFDFTAGVVPRAPSWIRMLRCEWIYRLAIEPGRLWRRYVLGNPVFLWRVARQKWQGGKSSLAHQKDMVP